MQEAKAPAQTHRDKTLLASRCVVSIISTLQENFIHTFIDSGGFVQ